MEVNELQEHHLIKERVINLLEEAKEIFSSHFSKDKEEDIKAFEELVNKIRNGRFSIIVVGEFSAGKSTFLNAIMHKKYLDSFSSETTANINFLRSVKDSPTGKPMIRVNYKDGNSEISDDVSFENIQKYVSTKGVDVAATIDSVEIFLDSPFLNEGVDLIDSPGLNGVKELHADITKNQMKASHAAIFMFRATQPGSKSDFQALIDLKKSCKSIIVVLNRIDEATKQGEETVEDIVSKLKNSFKEMFPCEKIPEIWPISAYKALVARSELPLDYNEKIEHTAEEKQHYLNTSLIEPFENRLMRYLTKGEKTKNELLSPIEKVLSVAEETMKELDMEKETLNGKFSIEDINDQIEALDEEIKKVNGTIAKKKNDVANAIYDAIRNAKNSIINDTKEFKTNTLSYLDNATALTDLENDVKLYVARIRSKYQSVYSDALINLEMEFRNAVRRNIQGSIDIINKQLSNVCDSKNELALQAIEIDSNHFNAEFDLSKYDAEIIEKLAERKAVREKQYEAEDKKYELESIQQQLQQVDNSLNDIKSEHIATLSMMQDPGIKYQKVWREREIRTTERSLINLKRWFGSKWNTEIQQYQENVPDYTEHNHFVNKKKELEKEYKQNISDKEEKRLSLQKQISFLSKNTRSARLFQIEYEEIEQEISNLRLKRDEELQKTLDQQLRKAKKYVEIIFDSLEQDSRRQAIDSIKEMEEKLSKLAMNVLEGEIKEELEIKLKKMEALKNKMTLAEKDKNERLAKLEAARMSLANLAGNAKTALKDIDSIKTDIIKEQ